MLNKDKLVKQYCEKFNYTDITELIVEDVVYMFYEIVSTDYIQEILDNVLQDIVDDVWLCSGAEDMEEYNKDDVKLAIGRVLIEIISK